MKTQVIGILSKHRPRNAVLVSASVPLPPLKFAPKPKTTNPVTPADEKSAGPSVEEIWQGERGKQLRADRESIEKVLGGIAEAVHHLQQDEQLRLSEMKQLAVTLAVHCATMLLREEIEEGRFPIEAKIRDMVGKLDDATPVQIRLNPEDLRLLQDRLGDEPLFSDDMPAPRIVADNSLGRGDCFVDARDKSLLSDLRGEIEEIQDDLLRRIGNAGT